MVTTNNGYISESNWVTCSVPEPPTIVIPNVFTPNNDGYNDLFVIRNLMAYDVRIIEVKNRWGKTVYRSTNYNNDWNGSNLPDGVYYGVLTIIKNNSLQNIPFVVTILGND